MANGASAPLPTPQFPTHNAPRVWLITSGDSPIGISVSRQVLDHGDYVVSGIIHSEFESDSPRSQQYKRFLSEVAGEHGWKDRMKIVPLDIRTVYQCQAAVAESVHAFKKIDILFCCSSEAVVGTVEELAANQRTSTLVRDQFEKNFFGPMNIIKAVIPEMRSKMNGHIIVLTGIHGHLGTPGLSMYCSAGWALEGFCDSIAYEVAPFNIKLTIVQASVEIGILTNKITSAPPMKAYSREFGHTAPIFRGILDGLLNRLPGIRAQYPPSSEPEQEIQSPSSEAERHSGPYLLSRNEVVSLYPPLSDGHTETLLAETVHALTAIGGHENPPARHIVGVEGVASVKEKLKTVSEELEEFADVSASADIGRQGSSARRASTLVDVDLKDVEGDLFDASLGLRPA